MKHVKQNLFFRTIAMTIVIAFMLAFVPKFGDTVSLDTYANDETIADMFIDNASLDNADVDTNTLAEGVCGANAYWNLSNDGVLLINGTGDTFDYQWQLDSRMHEFVNTPWYSMRDNIFKIIVEDGIVSLGAFLFAGCDKVVNVDVADSVSYIAQTAFDGVDSAQFGTNNYGIATYDDYSVVPLDDSSDILRYSVIILDTSGSMSGEPSAAQKKAAKKFCQSVLAANGENHVAIVKLNTSSSIGLSFTNDIEKLTAYIDSIYARGGTNINQALTAANELFANVPEKAIKNIILCSDGLPESGLTSYDGPYTSADGDKYRYANAVYKTSSTLKDKYNIYSLAFFHSLNGAELRFGHKLMFDIQNSGYYEVIDPDELEFTFDEVADDITNGDIKKLLFKYQSGKDYTADCYYSDNYFSGTSYEYKDSLATMSLCYAMSAFGSGSEPDYANKSINARTLLKDIGCSEDSIEVNDWFTKKPTMDSIGAIAGNKKIKVDGEEYTLIALAVRGGGYESEWSSNFTIGSYGQHQGFEAAKLEVINFLKNYISNQKISGNVKLWITGYSRAAATANLIGGALDSGEFLSNDISYLRSDIYSYCFETPAGALRSSNAFDVGTNISLYGNIYNIINSSDPVPYVAPAVMGFGRYGIDKYLPSAESSTNYSDELEKMLKVYKSLKSTDKYVVDDFQMKKIELKYLLPGGKSPIQNDVKNNFSQGVYLSNYVTYIGRDFLKTRSNYVALYQNEIREILRIVFGYDELQTKKLMDALAERASDYLPDLIVSYINPFVSEADALENVSKWLEAALNDAGITDYDKNAVHNAGIMLADLLLAVASNHPNYAITLALNIDSIGAAHYPELCYSWLASMDENYEKGATASYNNGSYRIIRINCDVDVYVYDQFGTLVASITDETPDDVSSIISAINDNEEKIIVLPVSSGYTVSAVARNDTTVNYGIDEYCAFAGDYTRAVDYLNIPLKESEMLTGEIPAYTANDLENNTPNGSMTIYTLKSPDGIVIPADSDISGDEALSAYFSVEVASSDNNQGIALGSEMVQQGNFVLVEAVANKGYEFEGWYKNGLPISDDSSYRFCVTENVKLVAKFKLMGTAPEHNHNYGASWNFDDDYHWHECECGEKDNVEKHISNNGEITIQPTITSTGVKTYSCSVCGYILHTETISATNENNLYVPSYPSNIYPVITPSAVVSNSGSFALTVKVATKNDTLTLTWNKIKGAKNYTIYQYKNGKYVKIKETDKTSVTYKKLKNGKTYKFIVRYTKNGKLSSTTNSGKISVTIKYKPIVKATSTENSVTLKWSAVDGAEKYAVYKYVDGKVKRLTETTKTTIKINKLTPKTGYSYIVRAYTNGKWTTMTKSDIVTIETK